MGSGSDWEVVREESRPGKQHREDTESVQEYEVSNMKTKLSGQVKKCLNENFILCIYNIIYMYKK